MFKLLLSKLFRLKHNLFGPCWYEAQDVCEACKQAKIQSVVFVTTTDSPNENHAVVKIRLCDRTYYYDPYTKKWTDKLDFRYAPICEGRSLEK